MFTWLHRLTTPSTGERGAALVEWGLLVVLIAVVALIAVTAAGETVSETYSEIASEVVNAGN